MRYWLYYLLGSLPYNWETLVVTLGNVTLDTLKSIVSSMKKQDKRSMIPMCFKHKALVTKNNLK